MCVSIAYSQKQCTPALRVPAYTDQA